MNGVITGSIEVVAQLGEARDTLQRALLLLESADARLPEEVVSILSPRFRAPMERTQPPVTS